MRIKDHAKMLGISWPASRDAVVRAFREQTMIWHPDRCARPEATQRMQEINAARDALLSVLGTVTPHASVRAPRRSRSRANPDDGRTGIRCPLTGHVVIADDGTAEDAGVVPTNPIGRVFSRDVVIHMFGRNPTTEIIPWTDGDPIPFAELKRLARALGTLFGGKRAVGNPVKQIAFGAIIGQHPSIDDALRAEARFVADHGRPVLFARPTIKSGWFVIVCKNQSISDRVRDRMAQENWIME